MKVVVRTDAGAAMGSGHVVRCLTLADALAEGGAQVRFVTRPLPPHLAERIAQAGHAHDTLDLPLPADDAAPQQGWPRERQHEDALATLARLAGSAPDWIVADHYGLDHEWEAAVRRGGPKLLAIDDLGRPHECDLLLDVNERAGVPGAYEAAGRSGARLLLGPAYALLRPEFARLRGEGLRDRGAPASRLLVFLGGMDAGNATGRVLDALRRLPPPLPALDVVVGAAHPALGQIRAFCGTWPDATCHVQTDRMAELMAACDAAVGAGGGATWERCCLGVPTLALALAPNQEELLRGAASAGLVLAVPADARPDTLAAHVAVLLANAPLRQALAAAGMRRVDGHGARRVAAALRAAGVRVRPARADDCDRLHAWRNAPEVRSRSADAGAIELASHRRWFQAVLESPSRALLVGEDDEGGVGAVRFDIDADCAIVSIHLAPARLGQGLGPGLLRAAESWLHEAHPTVRCLRADVLAGNTASRRLFGQAGYRCAFRTFEKRIPAA